MPAVVSNTAAFANGSDFDDAFQASGSYAADQEVWAELASVGAGRIYLLCRKSGSNYVLIQYNTSSGSVTRFQTGLESISGTTVAVGDRPGAGDAIGIECVGTSVNLWIRKSGNWTLNQTLATTTNNAGVIGFGVASGGPTVDAIYGGASVASGGPAFVQAPVVHGIRLGRGGPAHRIF
jgi:hypothetical protein